MHEPACGYYVHAGYFGKVNGKYMLFATEQDYYEYLKELKENV